MDKSVDHQKGVGRIDSIREDFRKFPFPKVHEFWNILRVNQISRELYDLVPARSRRGQGNFDILEYLDTLGVEIVLPDYVPCSIS